MRPRLRPLWDRAFGFELAHFDAPARMHLEPDRLVRADLAHIDLVPWILDDSLPWLPHVHDQFHHMGTARMNADPAKGVVDPQCFVHGIDNLAIASAAVFPASGHSNPTFTLLALTMRLADELKRRLQS